MNYVETYPDFQCDRFPRTLLRLNILGQSYLPWLLLVVMEEVKCATVRRSLLFFTVSTSMDFFFFFQWASLSLVEALKISEGGNALKHLISSLGS